MVQTFYTVYQSTNNNPTICDAPTEILINNPEPTAQFQQKSGETLTEQLEQLISDSTRYGLFPQEQFIQAQHKAYRMMEKDEEWQATASSKLQTFYTTAHKGNIGALAVVGTNIGKGDFTEANNVLITISAENTIEENYIAYYTAYIHAKTEAFTVSDSLALDELVYGCTSRDGEVVNHARVLHRLLYRDFTTYYDYCPSETQSKILSTDVKEKTERRFELYPNPNDGNMTLNYTLQDDENGVMIVYNSVGQQLADYTLDNYSTTLMISEDSFKNGVYFYSIVINNRAVETKQLVVIK